MADERDFEFQLRAQQEFKATQQPQQAYAGASSGTYVDPSDGTVYEWDHQRKGWFPKVDDDFIAAYQASYGVSTEQSETGAAAVAATAAASASLQPLRKVSGGEGPAGEDKSEKSGQNSEKGEDEEGPSPSKKPKVDDKPKGWFEIDKEQNHNVYVSGLPHDITKEEFVEMMSKCGIIMENEDGEPKVKLYRDSDGELKGDGLCCYLKLESINLALQILHESNVRGHTISVERAQFQQKGDYNPKLKRKKKKVKKKAGQEKLLDWRERRAEGPKRMKNERIIVFKHLFDPKEFDEDPTVLNDIRDDLRQECEKFGTVKKILIYDRHPEGVATLAFKEFEAADECVLKMNGRWYGGQQLEVSPWDGVTNYQVEETDQERGVRLSTWEKFLEEDDDKEKSKDQPVMSS